MDNRGISALSIILVITLGAFIFSFSYQYYRPVEYGEIKIEVLNGCEVDRLARATTDFLREEGFDVTFYGNAAGTQEKTVVIDRLSQDKKWAKIVANSLGEPLTAVKIDSSHCINTLIILGLDYKEVLEEEILERRLIGTR